MRWSPRTASGVPSATMRPPLMTTMPVAECFGLVHRVGHQDHGDAPGLEGPDHGPGVAAGGRIEPGGEFVEDDDLRVPEQRQRDEEPLLLTAGEVREARVALGGETPVGEELVGIGVIAVGRGEDRHGLLHLHPVRQHGLLQLDSDLLRARRRDQWRGRGRAHGRSRNRAPEPGRGLDRGGLARPVRAEDAEDLAARDAQARCRRWPRVEPYDLCRSCRTMTGSEVMPPAC